MRLLPIPAAAAAAEAAANIQVKFTMQSTHETPHKALQTNANKEWYRAALASTAAASSQVLPSKKQRKH